MALTAQQLRQFAEEGYLFLPGCFSEEEVAVLRDEAERIYAEDRQEVWREKTGAPRTAFAAHTYNKAFRLLGSHPRLIRPSRRAVLPCCGSSLAMTAECASRRLLTPIGWREKFSRQPSLVGGSDGLTNGAQYRRIGRIDARISDSRCPESIRR